MTRYYLFLAIIFFAGSCKTGSKSDRHYDNGKGESTFSLQLAPEASSRYHYLIRNESDLNVQVDDKKINNHNESLLETTYLIDTSSSRNFILTMQFDKIRVQSKTKDGESILDMDDTIASGPESKMFQILRQAKLTAVVTPLGEIKSLGGFDDIRNKAMAIIGPIDMRSRDIAAKQWNSIVGEGLIKKNMEQMFKIFPDSAVHVGDTWKLTTRQKGEISVNVKTSYTLKSADEKVAIIESTANLEMDSAANNTFMGMGSTVSLDGTQIGKFEMETQSGMLLKAEIITHIETTIQAMGRQIPVTVNNKVEINGRKDR